MPDFFGVGICLFATLWSYWSRYVRPYANALNSNDLAGPWLLLTSYFTFHFTICNLENNTVSILLTYNKMSQENAKEKQREAKSSDGDEYDDDCQYIFPQRLMTVLSDEKNHDAICWLPHGKAFIIRDRTAFADKVMPRFFPRKSKYSSFTRKLNRWYVSNNTNVFSFKLPSPISPRPRTNLSSPPSTTGTFLAFPVVLSLGPTITSFSFVTSLTWPPRCFARTLDQRLQWPHLIQTQLFRCSCHQTSKVCL